MWTIKYNGETRAFAEWGITGITRRLQSLSTDMVSFDLPGDATTADVFAHGSTITIYRDAVQWFVGRVDQTPRTASGRYEGHAYVIVGPWWYLENLVYQMAWKELANPLDPDEGLVEKLASHLILNLNSDGTLNTSKEQIRRVLQYAIDSGAPFQIGTIDLPDLYPPASEVLDTMCSEVVLRQLRWTPDAVGWVDYSTATPTVHIKQRSALARVSLPFGELPQLQIKPRYDLQVPAVVIKYRRTNLVNGSAWHEQVIDAMPLDATGREFKSLVATIDLEGTQVNYSTAEIVCADIEPDSVDWWKGQYAPLGEETVTGIALGGVTRESGLPRELVSGAVPVWLLTKQQAQIEVDNVRALATYNVVEGEDVLEKRVERPLHTEIRATDLQSGTYLNSLSVIFGQPAPVGLANYLYEATSHLHYDGQCLQVEDECSAKVGLGNTLCISGALPEYETMDAVVQSITETIDDGKTSVVFGPPKHLGADDIIEFLQGTRYRMRWTPITALTAGHAPAAMSSQSAKETPVKNSNADHGKIDKATIGEKIIIDRADNPAVEGSTSGREIRLRELAYCDNGVEKKILVLASEPY